MAVYVKVDRKVQESVASQIATAVKHDPEKDARDRQEAEERAQLEAGRMILASGAFVLKDRDLVEVAKLAQTDPAQARRKLVSFSNDGRRLVVVPHQKGINDFGTHTWVPLPIELFVSFRFVRLIQPGVFWKLVREPRSVPVKTPVNVLPERELARLEAVRDEARRRHEANLRARAAAQRANAKSHGAGGGKKNKKKG